MKTIDNIDNLESIGRKMVKMIKRAIVIIQNETHRMIVEDKIGYSGLKDDIVTSGDKKAQAMYYAEIRKVFPTFGIIAEEGGLKVLCTNGYNKVHFTIDPLCGTKAYRRKQSYGVATMITLICDRIIVAAVVGDINTGEIYYFADVDIEGEVNHERFGKTTLLVPSQRPLREQYVSLRTAPDTQAHVVTEMIRRPINGGLFKNLDVGGGSIGLFFARLWKGEIGGIIVEPGPVTPWDAAPIIGISHRLGFCYFRIDHEANTLTEFSPLQQDVIYTRPNSELIIHSSRVNELRKWYAGYKTQFAK
jgi:fructose-1,6-bisphosphatase/inositol monophosphatase family enzyme